MKFDFGASNANQASVFNMQAFLENNNNIIELPIDKLIDYPNQPFRRYSEEKLKEMADDIAQNGVLHPIIVRIIADDKYQILSGHNRKYGCELAGLPTAPCKIIYNCDDNQAARIMVNCNLNQREQLLPSEKAFAYKIQLETYNGKVGDFANENNVGRTSIFRYLRLTYLSQTLLDLVDKGKISLVGGENLSYLSSQQQKDLTSYIIENKLFIGQNHTETLKELCKDRPNVFLDDGTLDEVFGRNKKAARAAKKQRKIKINFDDIKELLPDTIDTNDDGVVVSYIITMLVAVQDKNEEISIDE